MKNGLVLETLNIQNFATFSNQQLSFDKHFNSIVGETGSGKSLILDALQLILGARADKKLVRKESEFASIEAVFSCHDDNIRNYFDSIGFPFQDDIIIKRIIYSNGKSKSYLNLENCHVNTLLQISRKYIDLVGQFENQKLLSEDYQLKLLDGYSGLNLDYKNYSSEYEKLKILEHKLTELNELKHKSLERREFLQFQVNEIEKLGPSQEDEAELKKQKDLILGKERNQKKLEEANYILSESDGSMTQMMSRLTRIFSDINLDESLDKRLENLKIDIEDFSFEIGKLSNFDFEDCNVEEVMERLDYYQKLKRKFNCDTQGLIEYYEKYKNELSQIEYVELDTKKVLSAIDTQSTLCFNLANSLHKQRAIKANELSILLTKFVHSLNMKGAQIDLRLSKSEQLNSYGISNLEFYAQTNPGEGFFPIKDIASGGELSRILLALRQVLSTTGSISVFLFDEIDTGVGGETALKIGKALKEVSLQSQVIAITHLPQIANFSDRLLVVDKASKTENNDIRTYSFVSQIDKSNISTYVKEMQAL